MFIRFLTVSVRKLWISLYCITWLHQVSKQRISCYPRLFEAKLVLSSTWACMHLDYHRNFCNRIQKIKLAVLLSKAYCSYHKQNIPTFFVVNKRNFTPYRQTWQLVAREVTTRMCLYWTPYCVNQRGLWHHQVRSGLELKRPTWIHLSWGTEIQLPWLLFLLLCRINTKMWPLLIS